MVTCPKCNKELSDGTKFCVSCGTQIFETIFCNKCGQQTSTEFAFCHSCGAPITKKYVEAQVDARPIKEQIDVPPVEEQFNIPPAEKKKLPQKSILFGVIGIIITVVILLAFLFFGGGKKSKTDYALYLKDNEIFFANLKKNDEPQQLTSRLFDSSENDDEQIADSSDSLSYFTYMSEDGKYIFFPDKEDDNVGHNLYYKEANKPKADAVKIDSNIKAYAVNNSATLVTYLKGEEGGLYQYKISEDSKEKIASEVEYFEVTDDGQKIIYSTFENDIYLKNAKKEKVKLVSDISSFIHVNENLTTVYYIKDGNLYKQVEGNDKIKVASDVYDAIKVYESGEIYYLKCDSEALSLKDYVVDDMAKTDASLVEPTRPNYPDAPERPRWFEYDTDEEYDAAYEAYESALSEYDEECERLEAEYDAAYDTYTKKENRDELREELATETIERKNYSLCFYNGEKEIVITDSFAFDDFGFGSVASDAPVISYRAYNQANLEKVKFSDIESADDIKDMIDDALFSSSEQYVAVNDTATVIQQEKEVGRVEINSSGTLIYYIDDIPDQKSYGTLYRVAISNGVVAKPEVYDNDVSLYYCNFVNDTDIKYFKELNDDKGELYINKRKIDFDVYAPHVYYLESDKIFYFVDYDSDKEYGTVKVYNGKEAVKIADDVHQFYNSPDGRVLYLYDYNLTYFKGELYEWSNGKAKKIDEDVTSIFPFANNGKRGFKFLP